MSSSTAATHQPRRVQQIFWDNSHLWFMCSGPFRISLRDQKMNEQTKFVGRPYLSKDFYHVADRAYAQGEQKQAGTYGESIMGDKSMTPANDPLGENLREAIRARYYPEKASRFDSVFVFDTQHDAEQYRTRGGKKGAIYKVKYIDPSAAFHRVCYTAFSMNDVIPAAVQAHDFWANPPIYTESTEIFAESSIEIIEEVSPALT